MLGAVDVALLVVVFVAGGEGQAGGVGGQGSLLVPGGVVLDVQGVVALLPAQPEGELDRLRVVPPVTELDLEDVAAVFGQRVDLLQAQPKFT